MTTFAERALPLVARSIAVFPCGPDKKPRTARGFKDATTASDQVAAWGAAFPDALVAVPTGGRTFVLDIDVDPAKGIDGFATLQANGWEIPATRSHKTRRGGAHYFFRTPEGVTVRNSAGKLGAGLDIRGEGGYVIRWDVHGGKVQNPTTVANPPAWLVEALSQDNMGAKNPSPVSSGAGAIAEGGRNAALASLAGVLRAKGADVATIEAALLAHNAVKCVPPLPDDEVRSVARSVGRYEPGASNPSDSETVARLAALSPLDYDRVRKKEAERLGIRESTLDKMVSQARGEAEPKGGTLFAEVTPWPEPVNGAMLLVEMLTTIKRFIACDDASAVATALWCAATWQVEVANVCPILLINAPEKACGKTQLLTVVGKLVPRPLPSSGVSPAVVYRVIEKYQPTLLVDEIETVLTKENEELRGLLNAGHTRDMATVLRCVGDDHEPTPFNVFGFKAVAGINADRLAETITSRAVVVHLRRKLPHEKVERLRYAEADLFATLRAKLARWAKDHATAFRSARPNLPDELGDRDQDNWEPLLTVADFGGPQWGHVARTAALKLCGQAGEASQGHGAELLADIRDVFEAKQVDRISMFDLLRALLKDDEKPWATWRRGQPLTTRGLGVMLDKYGVKSKTVSIGSDKPKGFERSQFDDVFARYL